MPAPLQGSIRSIVRERFLNVVREVQPASGWKVVVVDKASTKLLSCAVRSLEILEEGVSLIESLEIRRQPMPTMEAIYLIEPSEGSIANIKKDFESMEKCMYAAAHIYVTSHVSNELIYSLKQSPLLVSRCRSLRELNLEIFAIEAQCYHIGIQEGFHTLYSPLAEGKHALFHSMVNRLCTLCVTLGEMPDVRFMRKPATSSGTDLAEAVAKGLHVKLAGSQPVYWLYWCKSTNTDAAGGAPRVPKAGGRQQHVVAPQLH
jgi:syntaxin-binding protein 1